MTTGKAPILRVGTAVITFVTCASHHPSSNPRFFAAIPMVVTMQESNDVAHKSVGENVVPLPKLSFGASVLMTDPEGSCVHKHDSEPL